MTAPRPIPLPSSTELAAACLPQADQDASSRPGAAAELAAVAGARGVLFRFLSAATLAPPTVEMVSTLATSGYGAALAELLGDARLDQALRALQSGPVDVRALGAEYHRLFSVPGPAYLAPYAAMYDPALPAEGRLLQGPATRAVVRAYAASGYRPAPDFGELPDHIGAELAFLASLCEEQRAQLEAGATEKAEASARAQQEFLDAQLSWFGPAMAGALEARTTSPWFLCIAALLRAVALAEAAVGARPGRSTS